MASCGWDGVEYCYRDIDQWYDRPDEFQRKLSGYGLSLASLYISSGFENADVVAEHRSRVAAGAQFCARVGCDFVLIDGGARNDSGDYSDEDFKRVADAANACGEICRDAGLRCSWHQHWGSMFEWQANFDRLMEMTDPELVLCTPDTAQLALGDFDVVETVRTYAPRVQYIHFKDLGLDRRFTELGQGTIDFAATWEALGAESYEGWLVVDLDYTDLTADESCRVNKGYLNDTLGIKGLADGR
jgi:inosose dehydratase